MMDNQVKIEDFLMMDAENILRLPFKYKDWEIPVVTMGMYVKINPYIVKIAKEDLDGLQDNIEAGRISTFVSFMDKYAEDVKQIVHTLAGKDISEEATQDDYMTLLIATLYRIGGKSFLKSISLIQKLSLQTKAGIIAAEKRYMTSLNY